jgi:hypothetical protein
MVLLGAAGSFHGDAGVLELELRWRVEGLALVVMMHDSYL